MYKVSILRCGGYKRPNSQVSCARQRQNLRVAAGAEDVPARVVAMQTIDKQARELFERL
jgi:hypothetical protein